MSPTLEILKAGPCLTLQDEGRQGYLRYGLSVGGAADRLALAEGAALLGHKTIRPAIEMAGYGGTFRSTIDTRIALTGAPMKASLDGTPLRWNCTHLLPAGSLLEIGAAVEGVYGYLHIGDGILAPEILGRPSAHLKAGLGRRLMQGDYLALGCDTRDYIGLTLPKSDRFHGGIIPIVESLHTALFAPETRAAFCATAFYRREGGNRMGVPLSGSHLTHGDLSLLSDVVVPGDIQITGDGTPYVLLCECQTTGGYPRIGTVLPSALPRVAQAPLGATLQFQFVTRAQAIEIERRAAEDRRKLPQLAKPLIRNPHDIPDLLSYQLISGVTSGHE